MLLSMNRCTGHCCHVIRIPMSPDELAAGVDADGNELCGAAQLAEILISTGEDLEDGRHAYTCSAFVDGECSIYPQRPNMCADYPYGQACTYDECAWDAAREGRVPAPTHLPVWQPDQDPDLHLPHFNRPTNVAGELTEERDPDERNEEG